MRNDLAVAVGRFCLGLEIYRRTPEGRVRYRVQEGIGSESAPAPQATLMSLVIKGILSQQLPWT